jgi:hypothetical protein
MRYTIEDNITGKQTQFTGRSLAGYGNVLIYELLCLEVYSIALIIAKIRNLFLSASSKCRPNYVCGREVCLKYDLDML